MTIFQIVACLAGGFALGYAVKTIGVATLHSKLDDILNEIRRRQ